MNIIEAAKALHNGAIVEREIGHGGPKKRMYPMLEYSTGTPYRLNEEDLLADNWEVVE